MNNQIETEKPAAGCGRAVVVVVAAFLFTAAAGTAHIMTSNTAPPLHERSNPLYSDSALSISNPDDSHRSLSVALPHGGCQVTYASVSSIKISPTWQASFPGSGSRMTWSLVEALTGIRTNDDYDSHERGFERVVAVKTHYPVKDARGKFGDLDRHFGRAMVILRNPINAVPSYFNLQYEHQNHLPTHSTRGPNEAWVNYRDSPTNGLAYQLTHYENFVSYWMEKYPDRAQLLMLSYEELTDNFMGPIVAAHIANYLREVDGVYPIAPESIPCVWETIVNYKNIAPPTKGTVSAIMGEAQEQQMGEVHGRQRRLQVEEDPIVLKKGKTHADPSSLRVGPKVRPYTEQNLADMLAMFHRLVERYSFDQDFVRIMTSYIEVVLNTVPVND